MNKSRTLRIAGTIALLIAFGEWALAQSSGTQNAPGSSSQNPPAASSQNPSSGTAQNPPSGTAQTPPATENKKKDKKKKKESSQDILNSEVFSDAVAKNVLDQIRDGLEGHIPRLMESAFDEDKMDGYLQFEDQLEAMFNRYSEFRVHFSLAQNTVEGAKGIILVDIEMEEVPNYSPTSKNTAPVRKSAQVRFELERGKKGWQIVDFSPRSFFS